MSVNFDGTGGSGFNFGDVAAARFSNALAWTFIAFIRIANTDGDQRCLVSKWGGTSDRQILIRIGSGTAPQDVEVHHNNINPVNGGSVIELNTWYLVAVTSDSSNVVTINTLEMDGTIIDDAVTGTLTGNKNLTEPLLLGSREGTNDPFNGDMAYVAYLQRELTQNEILEYLRNPAKVVNRDGGASTGPVFFCPMINGTTTPDWGGQANIGTREGSGHTTGDNPPVTLYTGLGLQGAFSAAVAAARRIFVVS